MDQSLKLAHRLQEGLKNHLEKGLSKEAAEISRIEEFIKEAGVAGRSQTEVTRKFQYMADRPKKYISTLVEGGSVERRCRTTKGRPGSIFVHESFAETQKEELEVAV